MSAWVAAVTDVKIKFTVNDYKMKDEKYIYSWYILPDVDTVEQNLQEIYYSKALK
jgi:hypothetical protein